MPLFADDMRVNIKKLRNYYSKIYMENEKSKNSQKFLKKKSHVLRIILPNVKIYNIAVVMKIVGTGGGIDTEINRAE